MVEMFHKQSQVLEVQQVDFVWGCWGESLFVVDVFVLVFSVDIFVILLFVGFLVILFDGPRVERLVDLVRVKSRVRFSRFEGIFVDFTSNTPLVATGV